MATFQHALLDELTRYQAELADEPTPASRRRTRMWWAGAVTAATVAAGIAAVAVIPAGPTAPTANGVTINDDGTVTLDIDEVFDTDAAAAELNEAGIRTEIYRSSDCRKGEKPTPVGGGSDLPDGFSTSSHITGAVTFRPDLMPADLVFAFLTDDYTGSDGYRYQMSTYALVPPGGVECAPRPR